MNRALSSKNPQVDYVDFLYQQVKERYLGRIEDWNNRVFELVPEACGNLGPQIENHLSELVERTNRLLRNVALMEAYLYNGKARWESNRQKVTEFTASSTESLKPIIGEIFSHGEVDATRDLARTIAELEIYLQPWISDDARIKPDE
ncbi:MAG: hypothetical protein ACR2RB_16465 [Gammaproteobacteria bacterium]